MAETIPPGMPQEGPAFGDSIDEVQGVFPSDASLQEAIAHLTQAGFDRADISLPSAHPTGSAATADQGAENPTTDTDETQIRTLQSSMAGTVGALAAAGIVIATGGAALPAVVAAAAIGIGAGAATHAASSAGSEARHEEREADAGAGQLVLSVRIARPEKREQAEAAMRAAGASRIEAVNRQDGTLRTT